MKKLKLEPGAFIQEVLPIIGTDKLGWYHEDHARLVDKLLPRLRDEDGKPADLKAELDVIKLIMCPTEALQRKVLKETFAAAGCELDPATEEAFALLFNVTGFGDYLAKKENPKTKKPFIAKPKKAQKKRTFDALLAEEVEPEPQPVEQKQEAPKAATPRKAAKPAGEEPED